jgi:prepilin-type N-terminal cleavage/methylation domain-containing protein
MNMQPSMRPPRAAWKKQKGFTLVEVLITLGLVALFLFPLMKMFGSLTLMSADAETTSIATALATDRLEDYRRKPFGSLASAARSSIPYGGLGSFEWEAVVSATSDANLKEVRSIVYWSLGNRQKTVELRTLRANAP